MPNNSSTIISLQIRVAFPSQLRSKIIKDPELSVIAKTISRTNNKEKIALYIYKQEKLKRILTKFFLDELKKEVGKLTSHLFNSILRQASVHNFTCLQLIEEWRENAPLFLQALQSIIIQDKSSSEGNQHSGVLAFIGVNALYHRNRPHQALLHQITGQIVDSYKTTV